MRFPEDTGKSLQRIWVIAGRDDDPQRMYCGVEPAALFESRDAGTTWSLVRGLFDHPHRPRWEPGGGGLCLHTVLPHPRDPMRIHVAISTAGVYRTDDGGATWRHRAPRACGRSSSPTSTPSSGSACTRWCATASGRR